MSRPPPIPYDDESPRRRPPPAQSNNDNNVARRRANDSSPPPPRPPPRAEVGSPPQPARDMSAFFRQWGASSPGGGTEEVNSFSVMGGSNRGWSSGTNFEYDVPLQMDRSASFDANEPRGPARDVLQSQQHRRVASTGPSLPAMDISHLMMPQSPGAPLIDVDDTGVDVLGGHGLSALHDAARITDWPAVAALSESEPESARYVGPDGWNALHHACDRRCPYVDVIDSLLNAYPEALVQTNDKGWTPLHRACRNKTPRDVVKLLLRKYPELGKRAAGMRCNDGRSALHYALLYDAPEGVVDLLLQADPGAVLDEDRDGVTPLGTVWDKYANSFDGRRMLQILLRPFEGEGWELGAAATGDNGNVQAEEGKQEVGDAPDTVAAHPRQRSDKENAEKRVREALKNASPACKGLQTNWHKANTLLRAYFRFPLQEEADDAKPSGSPSGKHPRGSPRGSPVTVPRRRKWRILHATSAIKCHPKLFLMARALHPEQALEIDENDLYPNSRGSDIASSSLAEPQSPTLSHRTALHFAAMSQMDGKEGRNVIKVLLKLNPHAAQHADGYGSLPLHLICKNVRKLKHWTNCGHKDICQVYPAATTCRDGAGRTPLHCVASAAGQFTYESPGPTFGPTGISPAALEASVVLHLVDANRASAAIADNTGRLPLHYIAERCEEWTPDAQGILDAHPHAVSARAGPSAANQLPLHMAAGSPDARPSLIMELVSANPRAASLSDGTGRLPLHLAVDSGRTSWDRGIAAIYDAYPRAVSTAEEGPRKWTVLHTAAASPSAGLGLIRKIIELDTNNETAAMADGDGRFPLHLACASNRSWEDGGVRDIFEADSSVALSEDTSGFLPFHIAAMRSNCSLSTASNTSVESGSDSENGEDEDEDDLETLEVLFNLLIAQPSVVQV